MFGFRKWVKHNSVYLRIAALGLLLETINDFIDARVLIELGLKPGTVEIHAIKWGIMLIYIAVLVYLMKRFDNQRTTLYQKRLSESQANYLSLFKYNPDAIYICDTSGQVIASNPSFEEMTGFQQHELQYLTRFPFVRDHECLRARRYFELAMQGTPQRFETTMFNKFERQFDVDVTYVPMYRSGIVEGIYAIVQDITARKSAERELQQTQERIRQAEKLAVVGELAAGIAHEIRNPLTSIKGFLQLSHSKFGTDYIEVMLREVERINEITNELLLLAKPQMEAYHKESISDIVQNVITLMQPEANLHGVILHVNVPTNLHSIVCNRSQLKQVFINLIKNSIEAMPQGGNITINAVSSPDGVTIKVTDDGLGIPLDRLDKLGEPFYTTKDRGTGLGLMVTYRIIQNHHGTIRVSSQRGQGTTFKIFLPA